MMKRAAAVAVMLLISVGGTASAAEEALTPAKIAERARPSIVLVKTAAGTATGFVVASDGRIVTTLRAVAEASTATVVLPDGREIKDIQVASANDRYDLVVLRVPARDLRALGLGDSAAVKAGQRVVAIGHPGTVLEGEVSGVRPMGPRVRLLELTAPISSGAVGGPLFDDRGQVVGVATLLEKDQKLLAFGIPANAIKPMLAADLATPLATWRAPAPAQKSEGSPAPEPATRACPRDQADRIRTRINAAIEVGAPLYNRGNPRGCHDAYVTAALEIQGLVPGCDGAKKALRDAIKRARKGSWDARAWAMRHALDAVLKDLDGQAPTPKPPQVDASVLHGCGDPAVERIAQKLTRAIDEGAPVFDQGNPQACFYIYEAAVKSLDSASTCAGVRRVLRAGLEEAERRKDWEGKAWALRHAFDAVLAATAAHRPGQP